MRSLLLLAVLATLPSTSVAASNFIPQNAPGPHAVGLKVIEQYDYSRSYRGSNDPLTGKILTGEPARPVQTVIWYPAVKSAKPAVTLSDYVRIGAVDDDFTLAPAERSARETRALEKAPNGLKPEQARAELATAMLAHRDATAESGRFPILVYAPSMAATATENADLCEYLASQGYVVIASPSVGRASRPMTEDLEGAEAQAADIEFLIGYARSLPQADTGHIAVIGYSWGGMSNVLAAAKDSRIGALVSLDGSARFYPQILKQATYVTPLRTTAPLLYIASPSAELEDLPAIAPNHDTSPLNQMEYADLYFVKLAPMDHWNFNTVYGQRLFGWYHDYSPSEVSTATAWMETYVLRFLDTYLKGDAKSRDFLELPAAKTGAPAHMLTTRVTHSKGVAPTRMAFAAELNRQGFDQAMAVYQSFKTRDADFSLSDLELAIWGNDLMNNGDLTDAIGILKLDTGVHPESALAFDILGQAYVKHGDKALAIAAFRQALVLNPQNGNTAEQLKALEAKAAT